MMEVAERQIIYAPAGKSTQRYGLFTGRGVAVDHLPVQHDDVQIPAVKLRRGESGASRLHACYADRPAARAARQYPLRPISAEIKEIVRFWPVFEQIRAGVVIAPQIEKADLPVGKNEILDETDCGR